MLFFKLPTRFLAMVVNPLRFLGSSSTLPRGACLLHSDQHLAGLAEFREQCSLEGLYFATMASLARLSRASLGGVGVRSPPDNDIISHLHKETMDKAGKFLTRCDRRGRRLAPAGLSFHKPPTEKHNGKAGHTTPKRCIYCKDPRKKEQAEHYESESHYHFLHLSHLVKIIS